MAHHGGEDQISPEMARFILKDRKDETLRSEMEAEAKLQRLGATGEFPQGKVDPTDEGELRMGIAHTADKVILNFGKPVVWIGFDADQADEIAKQLHEHAVSVRAVR